MRKQPVDTGNSYIVEPDNFIAESLSRYGSLLSHRNVACTAGSDNYRTDPVRFRLVAYDCNAGFFAVEDIVARCECLSLFRIDPGNQYRQLSPLNHNINYAAYLLCSLYACSPAAWAALWGLWRLLSNLKDNRVFESENVRRRAEEQRILSEAEAQITETEPRILLLRGADWNIGVIGIVASRLVERYRRPAILFSEVNGLLVGSGRSVPAVDLFALLTRHRTFFTRFGGHRLAAGATLHPEQYDALKEALRSELAEQFPQGLPAKPLPYEDRLALSDVTPTFAKELALLSPFGEENRMPLFCVEGRLFGVRVIGRDGMHLSAWLSDERTELRLVAFGMGSQYAKWSALERAQALISIELSSYQGRPELSLRVEALRAPIGDEAAQAVSACIRAIRYGTGLPDPAVLAVLPKVSLEEIRQTYKRLLTRLETGVPLDSLSERECSALLPLYEIGVLRYENEQFFAQTVQEKKQIQKALLYPALCLE